MEKVRVFCLLLLVCSLSGAELQDNEITEQRKPSPVSLNVSDQSQSCLSDIHAALRDISAVLRDMSAALAEHRVRIEQLQTQNQEQAAKLTAIEKKQTNEVNTLKQQQQAQASKVDTVKQQQEAQAAELKIMRKWATSVKSWANVTENQVASLSRDRAVGQVAFSASLLASGAGTLGPFNAQTNLVFRHVVSNIGNAYNPNTGFFTAPVRGAYHFEFYIFGPWDSSHCSAAVLVKNGEPICLGYELQRSGHGSSSNGATLLLEAGDVVFLRQWENSRIYDNGNHHNMFSGFLLFLM